ncbi:MAG: hypothetical protein IAE90_07315 [Ignavibacteria bacterium]|nr:hypothetical protein [Ignavibacteria bacterium]
MKYDYIKIYSDEILQILKQGCRQIEIAGSIRRKMPECKDIDLVCIPDRYFLEKILLEMKRSNPGTFTSFGSLNKRFRFKAVNIDVYIADEKNFGWIYYMRTGPVDWNKRTLMRLAKFDVTAHNGYLFKNGTIIRVENEQTVFDLLKVGFIEPERRV